jgi:hypothetical protein
MLIFILRWIVLRLDHHLCVKSSGIVTYLINLLNFILTSMSKWELFPKKMWELCQLHSVYSNTIKPSRVVICEFVGNGQQITL